MRKFRTTLRTSAAAAALLGAAALAGNQAEAANIAETAQAAGSFQTLLTAAEAAGAVPLLTGDEPYTVFAPTDEAFAKLPAGTVESLLQPENKAQLRTIINYHIVPGAVTSGDILGNQVAPITMALKYLYINGVTANGVFIDNNADYASPNPAQVVQPDIVADNGVIHVIDNVLIPQ
jgi:uncharacterized surface protein with fasciclin (FAS1) repeats